MADLDGYSEKLGQMEIHLGAMAGVLGRFRVALIESGFTESEAAAFALEWWRFIQSDDE